MKPLVSIIMPAYNGEAYIAQAIRSVLGQTYEHWELVLVDDGSTDSTHQIVASFHDSRIIYIHQDNRGQAAALNHGLDLAGGDYLTTLDVDDWYTPHSLYDRVSYLGQHPKYSAVYGDGLYCDETGKPFKRFSEYRRANIEGDLYEAVIETSHFGTGAPVMICRHAIDARRLRYDESIIWCQDWDFYIRLAETACFGYVDSILVYYRIHGANMSTVLPEGRRLDAIIRTKKKVLESRRFANTSTAAKSMFFYYLLIDNLRGRPDLQESMTSNPHYRALPPQERARLFRLMAADYILAGTSENRVRQWLKSARKANPADVKLLLITLLIHLNKHLARFMVRMWRTCLKRQSVISPLNMIKH